MIKPEQVPNEAIREAMQKFLWHMNEEETPVGEAWSIVIAAALNAWPGAYKSDPALFGHKLILPLTEKQDDKA